MKTLLFDQNRTSETNIDGYHNTIIKLLELATFDKDDKLRTIHHNNGTITIEQDADYKCLVCGEQSPSVVIHHVFNRSYKFLVDHPLNWIPLCCEHHTDSSEMSAHKTPKKFKEFLINQKGEGWWSELVELANDKSYSRKMYFKSEDI